MKNHRLIYFLIIMLATVPVLRAQQPVTVHVNCNKTYQVIDNFGASDAWACQFAGHFPDPQREQIADWLFSLDTLANGNPKGIGLSLWRYNLGAGSTEQGSRSRITDEWRRASLTTSGSNRVQAQNWFLQAAAKRGVQQFLGFFNSPPVQFTRNGIAHADKGVTNIDSSRYSDFATYAAQAVEYIRQQTGITLQYLSPVNEPQWDWSDEGQEGCPYTNREIAALVQAFSKVFTARRLPTQLLVTEAGSYRYLLPRSDKPGKDDQVNAFFSPRSATYIGNLPGVLPAIAAHSYFTTSPYDSALALRTQVQQAVSAIRGLRFWQSEYCILGGNAGEINGNHKDTGINAALYLARVIHQDLAGANASAWQWWTAVSAYDYKDGLVYIDKQPADGGKLSDSKMLWAFGNYSRFVRPQMKRVEVNSTAPDLLVSGYTTGTKDTTVLVLVNSAAEDRLVAIDGIAVKGRSVAAYITSSRFRLQKTAVPGTGLTLPAKSITTIVIQ